MRGTRTERRPLPPGFSVLWTTVALDLIGFGIAIPVLALFAENEFGASPTQAGFLFATFSLAQFCFAPLLGRLSDRIGRKPVILLSLFGTAVGSILTGAAGALWVLFLGRAIDGASGASVSVAQAAATDLASPADRPRVLGLLGAAFGLGFTVGPAIGGLAAWIGDRRTPFYVAGVLALVNGLVAIRRLPETRVHTPSARPARRAGLNPQLVRFAGVGFVSTAAFAAFEATFSLLGDRRFELTESSVLWLFVGIGVLLSLIQGGAIVPLTRRFGGLGGLRLGLVCNAVGLCLLAAATNWPLLLVALALLVVGQGTASPTLSALVASAAPESERGRTLGVQQSVSALARVLGPAAGGLLFDRVGIPAPYLVGAGLLALALLGLAAERESLPAGLRHGV